jgi:hypothetical protein
LIYLTGVPMKRKTAGTLCQQERDGLMQNFHLPQRKMYITYLTVRLEGEPAPRLISSGVKTTDSIARAPERGIALVLRLNRNGK